MLIKLKKANISLSLILGLLILCFLPCCIRFGVAGGSSEFNMADDINLWVNGYGADISYNINSSMLSSGYSYQLGYSFDVTDDSGYEPVGTLKNDYGYCFYSYIVGYVNNSVYIALQSINETNIGMNSPTIDKILNLNVPGELTMVKFGFQLTHYIFENDSVTSWNYNRKEVKYAPYGTNFQNFFDIYVPDINGFTIHVNLGFDDRQYVMNMTNQLVYTPSEENNRYIVQGNYIQNNGEEPAPIQSPMSFLNLDYFYNVYPLNQEGNPTGLPANGCGGSCNVTNFMDEEQGDILINTTGTNCYDSFGLLKIPDRVATIRLSFDLGYNSILADLDIIVGDESYYTFLKDSGYIDENDSGKIPGFMIGLLWGISFTTVAVLLIKKSRNCKINP